MRLHSTTGRTIAITASSTSGCSRGGPALCERVGVVGVLHEQEQLALGPGVEEQRAGTDVGLVGDLLRGDLVDPVLGEELASGGGDAVELVLLVALTPPDRLVGRLDMTCPSG